MRAPVWVWGRYRVFDDGNHVFWAFDPKSVTTEGRCHELIRDSYFRSLAGIRGAKRVLYSSSLSLNSHEERER